ncbi:hypothetical protein RD110_22180 [Rhodoferax koreense]|uniref:Tricarboxylic transporter n=1 Tax=Rhodoferax koreensis TaxID=1842727 RepID=A0A1P8K4F3_9BURK|nr:tripartite tricarboxylate transporter substrate-binding protein [Rhodoferax koreense]APW40876.1 hypothetical protein RD110_22180 [Rhodoferax koreense]
MNWPLRVTRRFALQSSLAFAGLPLQGMARADILDAPECIVPAKVGGGFDLTCKLVGTLIDRHSTRGSPLRVNYLPGGIGAVAYDRVVTGRLPNPHALIAFSGGSLLNLAQGKFGPHQTSDVRWVAAVGTDYGAIAVPKDSAIHTLQDLKLQLQRDLSRVVFGAGGTVGSQDWVKAALIVKAAGLDHKGMRFVSFEGGGEAISALEGRHVTVFCGDAAEAFQAADAGANIRVIAILSDKRVASRPTVAVGIEQGFNLVWPVIRGVYVGQAVSDAEYRRWVDFFEAAMLQSDYASIRQQYGLSSFTMTGEVLTEFVGKEVVKYRGLAQSLGLRVPPQKT